MSLVWLENDVNDGLCLDKNPFLGETFRYLGPIGYESATDSIASTLFSLGK